AGLAADRERGAEPHAAHDARQERELAADRDARHLRRTAARRDRAGRLAHHALLVDAPLARDAEARAVEALVEAHRVEHQLGARDEAGPPPRGHSARPPAPRAAPGAGSERTPTPVAAR